MGKSQKREASSRLTVILLHLLKWEWQPDKGSTSWRSTLSTQRRELRKLFQDSPSLRRTVGASLLEDYPDAVRDASIETGLPLDAFPRKCPFTEEQVLDQGFLPD